jgi:predicted small lipoprotein YifL
MRSLFVLLALAAALAGCTLTPPGPAPRAASHAAGTDASDIERRANTWAQRVFDLGENCPAACMATLAQSSADYDARKKAVSAGLGWGAVQ